MKPAICLTILSALALTTGCQSERTRVAPQSQSPSPTRVARNSQATYTVEIIPNPRLSATSREGDKDSGVYSSNIVAVYAHKPGERSFAVTNTNQVAEQSSR